MPRRDCLPRISGQAPPSALLLISQWCRGPPSSFDIMSMVLRRDLLYGDICDSSKSNDKNSGNVFLAIELCPHNIMETYVMVLNAITKFSEIFAAIELCQQITGPFAMNSHAIVVKPLPLHYCIMRSITVVVSVVRENCLQWGNYLLCSSVVNNPPPIVIIANYHIYGCVEARSCTPLSIFTSYMWW